MRRHISESEGPANAYAQAMRTVRTGQVYRGASRLVPKSEMRARIQNERKVELAFEEHRFWDVRRWKIATVTNNITTMGVTVSKISVVF